MRTISVFIASPGDLSGERKAFREVIDELNAGFGDGAGVQFKALGWEDTLASTGRRNQSVINEEIDRCDVFILAMHRRWGQSAPDAKPFSSYTEEEFYRALDHSNNKEKPEIFVFFKRVDPASEADPGEQLKRVMDFRRQLEETRKVLYHYFDDELTFKKEVSRHLRAFAKGELPSTKRDREVLILPAAILEEVERAKRTAIRQMEEAKLARDAEREAYLKLESIQLQIAEDAAELSKQGKIEFARQKFAVLVVESTQIKVLELAGAFYKRIGDLESVVSVTQKILDVIGLDVDSITAGICFENLGDVYRLRGEMGLSEEMFRKALGIFEKHGYKSGIGAVYRDLGAILRGRGELRQAEQVTLQALAIDQEQGDREGESSSYLHLGLIYITRSEYEKAEESFKESLEISEEIGNDLSLSAVYGNLGTAYLGLKKFELAEATFKKSLAIQEVVGYKEGMASAYGNLGNIYLARNEVGDAEAMYKKCLSIMQDMGHAEGLANTFGNLGRLYKRQGDYSQADVMYRKSLAIEESLDRKIGMANDYCNLAILRHSTGQHDKAEELFRKSLAINEILGRQPAIMIQCRHLAITCALRENYDSAIDFTVRAIEIGEVLGDKEELIMLNELLSKLHEVKTHTNGASIENEK
ncbi:tetratricopeptide repeat protein [Massilia sp. 9I]|uniref:tetratricopeptide repeat protein n=1 Tax=Massilia sp. 9I TaxID=2653152 RepID=UPI0012F42103|nr:tetratricopeptide repeat protein [Massilia sp. 9I]VXB31031.1 conserved hypothetical protein [Massilia sp. 9I]